MKSSWSAHSRWRLVLAVLALALAPAGLHAQATGRILGTVTGQDGAPVYGAQVNIVGTRLGALTNQSGQFVITTVPAGQQTVRVSYVGFRDATAAVTVVSGDAVTVSLQLQRQPVELGGVVVSAARRAQRITEAPATITQITPDVIDNSVGNTFAGALKQAVGLDFVQTGMTTAGINARGFNSSFNNRMLMIEDGRVAVLPESGLPIGAFTTTPKVDLAGMEVLVGPGAALYGADASSGVLMLTTKDPRQFPGTTVEVTGGNREYRNIQARHAGVMGNWGYKATAEFQSANEWDNQLKYTAAALPETGVGGSVNWQAQVRRGQGSLVRYFGSGRAEVSAGMSETDGIGQTNVGRNQFDGWTYNFAQARVTLPNWFFQAYRTQSQSGDSYALNRFTEFRAAPANAQKSDEEIRLMSDWPSNGRIYAAEAQNNFRLPALLNTRVVWGGQIRRDVVSSDRQWLIDRKTEQDLTIAQAGAYAQVESPLMPWLDLVLAGRYDKHDNYDAQFSPKVGLVVKPMQDQAFRVTYNRAFKSPTILQTSFFIPDFVPGLGVYGNTDGFEIRRADSTTVVTTYKPLVPEENQTWEVGYKGVLAERLFIDVTGYAATYENFISPLSFISLPAGGTFAWRNDQIVRDDNGRAPIVMTYFNLGTAKLRGVDAGINYFVTPKLNLRGTLSHIELQSMEGVDIRGLTGAPDTARIREASTLNSSPTKWTLGANLSDIAAPMGGSFRGGLTVRHVDSYFFASGINKGTIPTFTTVDMSLGYRMPRLNNMALNVGVSNLFTCQSAKQDGQSDGCGFNQKHLEMINMPEIGTMVFVGVRYHHQ